MPRVGGNPAAWTSVAVTALFIALSGWWLAIDRAMPYGDAAEHLLTAFVFHDALRGGDWLLPFHYSSYYAPLTPFVGALAIFLGGRTVAAPVMAQNLVYVPLLALGCYHVGARVGGAVAGLLAVVFALGSPLIAEQFHVFMLDAPLTALVAATVWLVLASERFRRADLAAAAGLTTGLGLLSKQSFPLYVAGFLILVVLRERGWRNWRGLGAYALTAFVVAAPWYIEQGSQLGRFTSAAEAGLTVPVLARPPLLSWGNVEWYFWAVVNGLLFVPLLALATIGIVTAGARVLRARGGRERRTALDPTPELLGGLALAWLALTVMPHHDMRYAMPLTIFLATLGTAWIVPLRGAPRVIAIAALTLAVVAATLGATFGLGPSSSALLPGNRSGPLGEGVPPLHRVTIYSNHNYMVSGPRNGGDILGLLNAMRREGIRQVVWSDSWAPLTYNDFNANGLLAFVRIAEMPIGHGAIDPSRLERGQAIMFRMEALGAAPPCAQLSQGQGVWIRLGNPDAQATRDWCPRYTPHLYGP